MGKKMALLFVFMVVFGLVFLSCMDIEKLIRKSDDRKAYMVTKDLQQDIRGDILTENFLLMYFYGGMQQLLVQRVTQNNKVAYRLANRFEWNPQATSNERIQELEVAMTGLMVKTDIGDVFTFVDKQPEIKMVSPDDAGSKYLGVVIRRKTAVFPIPNALLEQRRKYNSLTWQYVQTENTVPISVPKEGIIEMQHFLNQ